jgi:signal transduction histidine kinase
MRDHGARRWWRGVRARIAASAALLVAIVLVVVSVVLVETQRDALTDQLDESLAAEAERIAASIEEAQPPLVGDDDLYVVVVDSGGRVVFESLGDEDLDASSDVLVAAHDGATVIIDSDPHRVVSEEYDDGAGEGRVIVAGASDDIDDNVGDLIRALLLIVPAALAALLVVVWMLVGRALRSVERIRARVASIDVGALAERVPVPEGGDELTRLAETMNAMLDRLDESVRRQQRFAGDASHELRTPLTRMRTELEVDERDPATADPAATRRSQLDEIEGMQRMIEDLLLLARGDAGSLVRSTDVVDLDDVVLEEVGAQPPSPVTIDASSVSAAQVLGSRDELQRVVRNLLDNARRHATGRVEVGLAEIDGTAVLTVADDGPGIAVADRQRVLERFARLDESRTGGGRGGERHAGLGLAIVHDIVRRHAGTLTIGESRLGGAEVSVHLPPSRSAAW